MNRLTSTIAIVLVMGCRGDVHPKWALADSTVMRAAMSRIDDATLAAPDSGDWPQHGRTRDEQRHSPLRGIDSTNVHRLGIAWSYDLGAYERVEATPIVVDGVMYVTGPWNVVHALDAASGQPIWRYDPGVPRRTGTITCCGAVNRGVAVYAGRVYVGTLDGRLIALDAATGAPAWSVSTTEGSAPYSITGAPRAGHGLVFIGNGGAEFGVRGYVSAYDAQTGALRWRTYTVPGNPSSGGVESAAMRVAARTWSGEWWKYGGGGTAWDAIVVDPGADRIYVGTGNGSPWLRSFRSPGGGDNLYLASILALDATSGKQLWHHQTTPGETWDYTATQPIVLASVVHNDTLRDVLLQAPKNGYFYVIDRGTGKLLSATPLVPVTWSTGIDSVSGRPIENVANAISPQPVVIRPSPSGAHNWHPVAYNASTGLVYLTVTDAAAIMALDTAWRHDALQVNRGILLGPTGDPDGTLGKQPDATLDMVAWDPVRRTAAWRVRHPGTSASGALSVAGGVVFTGRIPRRFVAYRATDGELLWEHDTGANVEAGAISYMVDGRQYVAVTVGNGVQGPPPVPGAPIYRGRARVLAFALDARGVDVPQEESPRHPRPELSPDELRDAPEADLRAGNRLYDKYCVRCHGPAAESWGPAPDLRHSTVETRRRFGDIVRGALVDRGMPSFAGQLSEDDVRHLQAYILSRARLLLRR